MILVGNKIDLRGGIVTNQALEDEILPIMNEFKVRRWTFIVIFTSFESRKWKHVLNVPPGCPSMSPKSSILLKRRYYIRQPLYMTLEIMSVLLLRPFFILF